MFHDRPIHCQKTRFGAQIWHRGCGLHRERSLGIFGVVDSWGEYLTGMGGLPGTSIDWATAFSAEQGGWDWVVWRVEIREHVRVRPRPRSLWDCSNPWFVQELGTVMGWARHDHRTNWHLQELGLVTWGTPLVSHSSHWWAQEPDLGEIQARQGCATHWHVCGLPWKAGWVGLGPAASLTGTCRNQYGMWATQGSATAPTDPPGSQGRDRLEGLG